MKRAALWILALLLLIPSLAVTEIASGEETLPQKKLEVTDISFELGVIINIEIHADAHTVVRHFHLHGAVFVIIPAPCKRDHIGVVIHKEPHILQIGVIKCASGNNFVIPSEIRFLFIHYCEC